MFFDNTAIVTYDFEMKYEQKDKGYHETGTDIMYFYNAQATVECGTCAYHWTTRSNCFTPILWLLNMFIDWLAVVQLARQ